MIFMVKHEEFALVLTTKISQNLRLRGNFFHKSVKRANVFASFNIDHSPTRRADKIYYRNNE